MGRWIVARSHPSREVWAAEQCTRQGFSVFLPRILELNGRGARRVALAKPLFPSYLFIEIEQRWRPLLSTFGFRSVIMRGEAPDIVPLGVIEQLRRRQDPDGFIELPKRPPKRESADKPHDCKGCGIASLICRHAILIARRRPNSPSQAVRPATQSRRPCLHCKLTPLRRPQGHRLLRYACGQYDHPAVPPGSRQQHLSSDRQKCSRWRRSFLTTLRPE
jgi:Transcription termination factor nusG